MTTAGQHTYTAHATNNFGCEYTQDVEVEYVAFSPAIDANPTCTVAANPWS